MSDWDWIREKDDQARRETAEALARARAEADRAGKETFDYGKLVRYYDPTSDLGTRVIDPAETAAALERRYYLDYPAVMTLKEFADRMNEYRTWR